jgi:hypothetical protein
MLRVPDVTPEDWVVCARDHKRSHLVSQAFFKESLRDRSNGVFSAVWDRLAGPDAATVLVARQGAEHAHPVDQVALDAPGEVADGVLARVLLGEVVAGQGDEFEQGLAPGLVAVQVGVPLTERVRGPDGDGEVERGIERDSRSRVGVMPEVARVWECGWGERPKLTRRPAGEVRVVSNRHAAGQVQCLIRPSRTHLLDRSC